MARLTCFPAARWEQAGSLCAPAAPSSTACARGAAVSSWSWLMPAVKCFLRIQGAAWLQAGALPTFLLLSFILPKAWQPGCALVSHSPASPSCQQSGKVSRAALGWGAKGPVGKGPLRGAGLRGSHRQDGTSSSAQTPSVCPGPCALAGGLVGGCGTQPGSRCMAGPLSPELWAGLEGASRCAGHELCTGMKQARKHPHNEHMGWGHGSERRNAGGTEVGLTQTWKQTWRGPLPKAAAGEIRPLETTEELQHKGSLHQRLGGDSREWGDEVG